MRHEPPREDDLHNLAVLRLQVVAALAEVLAGRRSLLLPSHLPALLLTSRQAV